MYSLKNVVIPEQKKAQFFIKISELVVDFTWNQWNYGNRAWKGFHNLELKWNVILWNVENCLEAWIFRESEFTRSNNWLYSLVDFNWTLFKITQFEAHQIDGKLASFLTMIKEKRLTYAMNEIRCLCCFYVWKSPTSKDLFATRIFPLFFMLQ